jgi:hypothetical protein
VLHAQVVSLKHGLRALPRLIYADAEVRGGLAMSLLPPSYTDLLGLLLTRILEPSPAVCAEMRRLSSRMQQPSAAASAAASPPSSASAQAAMPQHATCPTPQDASATCLAPGLKGGVWYVAMHLRASGWWDPSGSSSGSLFGMRHAGVARSLVVLEQLLSHRNKMPHMARDEDILAAPAPAPAAPRQRGEGVGAEGREVIWLASDSGEIKEAVKEAIEAFVTGPPDQHHRRGRNWTLATSPHAVVHTAGAGACGDSSECRAAAREVTREQHVQMVAEWWLLALAQGGWILTRGSSFGLTAAAVGQAQGANSLLHAPIYTVHEHKVQRGLDCVTFHLCALHPPHATP